MDVGRTGTFLNTSIFWCALQLSAHALHQRKDGLLWLQTSACHCTHDDFIFSLHIRTTRDWWGYKVTASSPTVLEFHASLSIVCYIVRVYIRLFYFKVRAKKNLKECIVEGKPCYHGDGYWQTLSVCHLVRVYSFCCVYLQATISIPMVAGMDRWRTTPSTSWTSPPWCGKNWHPTTPPTPPWRWVGVAWWPMGTTS